MKARKLILHTICLFFSGVSIAANPVDNNGFFAALKNSNQFIYARLATDWQPDALHLYKAIKDGHSHHSVFVPTELLKHASGVTKSGVWQFTDKDLNRHFSDLFTTIACSYKKLGYKVNLTKYDLFHGHIFAVKTGASVSDVGILFHAKEYPRDLKLGYPEAETNSPFTTNAWAYPYRDFIWLASTGIIYDLNSYSEQIYPKYFLPDGVDLNDPVMQDVAQQFLKARTFMLEDLQPKVEMLGDINAFMQSDHLLIFIATR